jgi:type 2 lantibiotic biosynthesis protein LanM
MRESRFDVSLGCLFARPIAELATQISSIPGLSPNAQARILSATQTNLVENLNRKLSRLLVLELNAARVEGRLKGETAEERWEDFLAMSSRREFWDGLSRHYPTLLARVDTFCTNLCTASVALAFRWAADRNRLRALYDAPLGDIKGVSFGAGDTHRGGYTVAILECESGNVVYKPRSVAPEAHLASFIAGLETDLGIRIWARVPKVIDCGDHGWVEFVPHRYAAGPDELHGYYEGIGHWLAIMHVMAGTDFHAENLIAHGPHPVVVDAETLFTPNIAPFPLGVGDATDKAIRLVSGTVLATGLLPRRGSSLGWRGVDMSGVGALTDQQPVMMMPDIIGAGTDQAKYGISATTLMPHQNHPTAAPSLLNFWPDILNGFEDLSTGLRRLDAAGDLHGRLAPFETCRVRVIVRPTEVYAEIGRMLWHPVSLHKEGPARDRARDLFAKMAANLSMAPSAPDVIDAEIDDLMVGDIPFFSTIARDGVLEGRGGVRWLPHCNLVEDALAEWRKADLALEANYIRTTLVSAYANDDWQAQGSAMPVITTRGGDLERRRRAQAAVALRKLMATAIRGDEGSVTWVAPTLTTNGFSVEVLASDVYGGLSGIAVAVAAYLKEQNAGRADVVEGAEAFLAGILKTLHMAEDKHTRNMREGVKMRPPMLGGYLGYGSQIWRHLVLTAWGFDGADGLARAGAMAREMPAAASADDMLDILTGRAGAIPPLLALARRTGNREFLDIAAALGDALCEQAKWDGDRAFWTHERWPEGLGGFAHGVTGIGWSLHKLARATGDARHLKTAKGAFAFEDSLFDAEEQNWLDLRNLGGPKTGCAWCHGAVGIALARLDLDPQLTLETTRASLRAAAATAWQFGFGWSHCACHGSLGVWALLDRAIAEGVGPEGLTREQLLSALVTSLEESGPSYGMLKEAFVPGLLLGMSGVVYELLRAHPESKLPSFLVLEDTQDSAPVRALAPEAVPA